MKRIKLTKGYYALVDDRDFVKLNKYKWQAEVQPDTVYAMRRPRIDGKSVTIKMHRQIMNTPKGIDTDHRDRNGLNNQRYNLRKCTRTQNNANSKKRINNTSGIKGVCWDKNNNKWFAQIQLHGKMIFLGRYTDKKKAAAAYAAAARKYFKKFARLT